MAPIPKRARRAERRNLDARVAARYCLVLQGVACGSAGAGRCFDRDGASGGGEGGLGGLGQHKFKIQCQAGRGRASRRFKRLLLLS